MEDGEKKSEIELSKGKKRKQKKGRGKGTQQAASPAPGGVLVLVLVLCAVCCVLRCAVARVSVLRACLDPERAAMGFRFLFLGAQERDGAGASGKM